MRESVLSYKEQAVAAVTAANMLQSALTEQKRMAAEKELQALYALQEKTTGRRRSSCTWKRSCWRNT